VRVKQNAPIKTTSIATTPVPPVCVPYKIKQNRSNVKRIQKETSDFYRRVYDRICDLVVCHKLVEMS